MPFWTKKLPPRQATAPSLLPSHPMADTSTLSPEAGWNLALLLVVQGYGAAACAAALARTTVAAGAATRARNVTLARALVSRLPRCIVPPHRGLCHRCTHLFGNYTEDLGKREPPNARYRLPVRPHRSDPPHPGTARRDLRHRAQPGGPSRHRRLWDAAGLHR